MPPELAAMLARRVIVVALDTEKHAAFCQGFGDAQDLVGQLAAERVAQGSAATPADQLVADRDQPGRTASPPGVAFTLAHELGARRVAGTWIPDRGRGALSEEQIDEREREADAFAER
jgi:hypothetical protein